MSEADETNPETNHEQLLESVIADFIRACEAGNEPDRRKVLDGHPQLAADLRQFFAQRDRMHQLAAPIRDFSDDLFQSIGPGQQISYVGNYELLEEVARGGMGVVYKARQVNLGRIVAVKMIMAGRLASDDDVKRFQVEAKAAAGLQHPHIVSIHEVGQHEGWHYFSMDFVNGRDLSTILHEKLLSAKQAATYVQQMAEAIHYAHQQGTLHRDLKPSNILIDDQNQIRITDFGLAMRAEDDSDLTRTGQILGTPSYMPPEQAQGKRSLIGPGSDVYAMGAVLYECLTGRPPFRAGSVVETIQQVIGTEAVSPRMLNPGIPRDLETICLKCLQKEPHRRYGTAQLLADDLLRFLENRPISARPVGSFEQIWRWTRRNPRVSALSAAVLLLSTSIAIGSTVGMFVINEQKQHAELAREAETELRTEVERQKILVEGQRDRAILAEVKAKEEQKRASEEQHRAKESEADATAFSEFLVKDVLAVARPEGVQGGLGLNVTIAQALESAEAKLQERFKGRLLAEATARDAIGKTFRNLSKYEPAELHLRRAVELREHEFGPDDPQTLDSQNSLGVTLNQMGRCREALEVHELLLERGKRVFGPDHPESLMYMSNLAEVYRNLGKLELAVSLNEETVKKMTEVLGAEHPETLRSTSNLALAYQAVGQMDMAIPLLESTLAKRRIFFGPDHPKVQHSVTNLASAYEAAGRREEALPLYESFLKMSLEKSGPDHVDTITCMNNLANAYMSAGKPKEALVIHQQVLAKLRTILGPDHQYTWASMNNLASAYRALGRQGDAEPLLVEAVAAARRSLGFEHQNTQIYVSALADCYDTSHQFTAAEPIRREVALFWKGKAGAESVKYARELASLSKNLLLQQKAAEAEPLWRECLTIHKKIHPDAWITFNTMSQLGVSLIELQRYSDAEPHLLAAHEGMEVQSAQVAQHIQIGRTEVLESIVKLYEVWGKTDTAEMWRAKLADRLRPASKTKDATVPEQKPKFGPQVKQQDAHMETTEVRCGAGPVVADKPVNTGIAMAAQDERPKTVARQADAQIAEKRNTAPFDAVVASQQDRKTLRVGPGDWPQWGGSRLRNNTPVGKNIPSDWDIESGHNIKWAAKLGSQTYGNPSVANGKVFIGSNNGNGYLKRYPAEVDLGVMLCFEEATGKFLWQYSSPKLAQGRVHDWPQVGMPSTPVVDGDRVWAVTNRCEVICLDTEGFRDGENDGRYRAEPNENPDEADIVWRFDMLNDLGVFPHNMSNCSILIADEVLFVCTSNGVDEGHIRIPKPDAPSFVAMDRDTGKVLWSDNSPGSNILHSQWASPSYAVIDGQPQVIFPGGDGWVYSFDPKGNGLGGSRLLWKFDANPKESIYILGGRATRNQIISFPAIYDGLVYITVGEDPEHGEGVGHLWCIDPSKRIDGEDLSEVLAVDAAGNVIPHRRLQAVDVKQGERAVANPDSAVRWHYFNHDQNGNGKIDFEEQFHRSLATPAIKDDILYVTDFAGLVHCLNARTGDVYWTHDLFASSWGSALVVDDKVYIGDEDGKVSIFPHSSDPGIGLPNRASLGELTLVDSMYSTPIVANSVLYIATKNTLYAIQEEPENGPRRNAIQVLKNSIEMELVLIPPGKFRMGSRRSEPGSAKPVDATLSNGFYLGKTEVTQGQWKAVMGTTPWQGKDNVREGDNYPATFVSWDDAREFCTKLSEKEHVTYRLPTEAQWEYACSSRATTRYSFGDDPAVLGDYAWWGAHSPLGNTKAENYAHEVGAKRANHFGLHDMHGNVWEWCEDYHVQWPAGGIDPRVFDGGLNRVFRGGSWDSDAIKCRSAFRFANLPWGPKNNLGFRVVREKDATAEYLKESIPIRSLAGQHQNVVTMALFSPDGEIVVSTSEDGTAVLWQWQKREPRHVLRGHSAGVLFAAFSPDGKTLATGGRDSKVIVWDVETGVLRTIIDDHTAAVSAVLYSQDGTTLVTGSSDKTVKVRDANGKLRFSLAGHQQEVIALALSEDGKTLVSAGGNWNATARDGELRVWDLETRTTRWSAAGEFGGIWSVALSPDGKQLAGASLDGSVRIWEFASGQPLSINMKHTDRVIWVAYEPGSQLLTSTGFDGQMYFWDADKLRGNQFTRWNNHGVQRFSFFARKKLMATAGGDGTVTIWQLPDAVVAPPPIVR